MNPADWRAINPGMGACFHQAIHRAAILGPGWFIAVGIVAPSAYNLARCFHAWLERESQVISAVTGVSYPLLEFYREVGIDPSSVRRVNPLRIMRRVAGSGTIGKEEVKMLLDMSGIPYQVVNNGVLPK